MVHEENVAAEVLFSAVGKSPDKVGTDPVYRCLGVTVTTHM